MHANNTVQTTLNYHLTAAQGGFDSFYPGTAGNYRRTFNECPVTIFDLRESEPPPSLDKQGFELHQHESSEKDFDDDEAVKRVVYTETVELIKQKTGATRVVPFSHIHRTRPYEEAEKLAEGADDLAGVKIFTPSRGVHVDQSYDGALEILEDNMSEDQEEAKRLTRTRWAIINFWRPIHHEASKDPLAVCDARSVNDADLIAVVARLPPPLTGTYDNVSKGRRFETWALRKAGGHKWYYASNMTPDEVLLIKIFDSKKDGRARRVPHTGFIDPRTAHETRPRESIEVRCLVFWEDQSVE